MRLPTTNGTSTSTPLVLASRRLLARRPLAQLNVFFTSAPPSNVRGRLHRLRRAAQARQTAAARVIFLWLRRRHLYRFLLRSVSFFRPTARIFGTCKN
jgi:hypothetical protein